MRIIATIFFCCCLWSLTHAQFINNTGIVITNSANLTTNGDWQNTGVIRNTGKITTSDHWQNAGTLAANSWGSFVLQYTDDKNFSAGTNSASIGGIQKEGVGQAFISGRVLVTDSLKILSGIIRMNSAADTLAISTSLVSVANGSYVDGPMAHVGAGTFSLPVGRSGQPMPIKFYNSTSSRVGVVVEDVPAGYSSGESVESISAFPFAWRSVKSLTSDTASYVEVKIPDALAIGITNPIVVKKVPGQNQFEGMGSRLVSSDGVNTTVRSYSAGLKGLFSIANGYPGNLLGDSTELVALYNSTSGSTWTNRTNWRVTAVRNWFGITEKGGRVTRIELPNNNVSGAVPTSMTNMNALRVFNMATNSITTVPNFTTIPAITTLDVSGNSLDFGSLESNASLIGVNYVNQAPVNPPLNIEIPVNTNYQLNIPVAGSSNIYQWKLNGQVIASATTDTYNIVAIKRATMGDYVLEITNPLVPGLVLTSSNQRVLATADIAGTLFTGTATPASAGNMRLLKVTPSGSYDTIRVQNLSTNGTYLFDNVVLDDYLVNGFADTIVHQKAIPTYYINTIFWEEADTLFLEDNVAALDIYSEFKPDPPSAGQGELTGTFYETVPDGRITKKARVKAAAVTVRRLEGSGKGTTEVWKLVAYLFTDEEGEFTFTKLDSREYRFNIQLPGYPMDTNTFVIIPIGNTLFDRHVGVEAEVISGKIAVRKLVITGWEEEVHSFSAYPNPTVEYLFIQGKGNNKNIQFQLTDSSGKGMETPIRWDELSRRWELNIQQLQRGVYFLQVHKNGKTETAKIMIE